MGGVFIIDGEEGAGMTSAGVDLPETLTFKWAFLLNTLLRPLGLLLLKLAGDLGGECRKLFILMFAYALFICCECAGTG